MKLNKYIFREYDIRGIYGKDITEEVSYLIGRAFGTKLKRMNKKDTIVGYDNRLSSPIIYKNLIKGIRQCGINITSLGLVTTPMYYYSWDLLKIKCGIMITASHNPKDENGFKFSYNGIYNACGNAALELYEMIINNDFEDAGKDEYGSLKEVNIMNSYLKMITSAVNLGDKKIKVVYDCGNGTTCIVADKIFNYFKDRLELVPLFNDSDPTFPNHHPDPAVEENLRFLKEKVLETKADLGIAFDGDGDRVGIVSEKGTMIDIDKFMIIVWRYLINKNIPKKTFYDIKCSLALKEELDKLGVENEFYRTGNSYTKKKSYEGNYPFAGELSGHVFFRDKFNGNDDGIYAGLRMIEILTNTTQSVTELLEGINKYYSTPEIKIPCSDEAKFHVIDKILNYCQDKDYHILTIDGVKVLFDDGTALVRASNTGPNLTCRYEAKSSKRLKEIENEFMSLINRINIS